MARAVDRIVTLADPLSDRCACNSLHMRNSMLRFLRPGFPVKVALGVALGLIVAASDSLSLTGAADSARPHAAPPAPASAGTTSTGAARSPGCVWALARGSADCAARPRALLQQKATSRTLAICAANGRNAVAQVIHELGSHAGSSEWINEIGCSEKKVEADSGEDDGGGFRRE